MYKIVMFILLFMWFMPLVMCPMPGTFFWKPRLGLEFTLGSSTEKPVVRTGDTKVTLANIHAGVVVLIDGYQVGVTIMALAVNIDSSRHLRHLNPLSAYYHTNAYRWFLRHLSLVSKWLSGRPNTRVPDIHKVWRKRFAYTDAFVPRWIRPLLPWVSQDEWKREEKEYKLFHKEAQSVFGKYNRYPSKHFDNWKSWISEDSEETNSSSSNST